MKNLTCLVTPTLISWALPVLPSLARSVYEPYTFTTLAGRNPVTSLARTGSQAMLSQPRGLGMDTAGNAYVADSGSHTIRMVPQAGVVATLAGLAGSSGSADGTGTVARFRNPGGVTVDGVGNVYVADTNNHTIRKVTRAGVVTTLAGLAGSSGSADGVGDAQFLAPTGVAVDSSGNVYVADSGNGTIRKVTSTGLVATLAGVAGSSGSADGTGSDARFALAKPLDLGGFLGFRGVALDCAGFDGPRFALNFTGQMGRSVTLEMSTDLVNCQFLGAAGFSFSSNQQTMPDPATSRPGVRFYHVFYQPVLFGE